MTTLIHRPRHLRRTLPLERWQIAIATAGLILMLVGLSAASHARGEEQRAKQADLRKVLIEARDAYVKDGVGKKVSPRTLRYIYMREGINHSPLLPIAVALAGLDDPQAVATAQLIESPPWRAFALIRVTMAQVENERIKTAKQTLAKAIDVIGADAFSKQAAEQLWPKVAGALLWIHGDIESAKAACAKLGCPWDSLDKEERQFELAKYHVSRGKIEKARQALGVLPADTFKNRKAAQSLQNDDGAGLYLWVQQPNSAYTAEHVLLEWLHGSGELASIEKLFQKLPDDDMRKLCGYLRLAKQYHHLGDAAQSAKALKQATLLKDAHKNRAIREAVEADLLLARLHIEGKTAARAIRDSGILTKHKDKPWIGVLFRPLLAAGELEMVEKLMKGRKLDGVTRSYLAIAMTKAGRLDDALAQAKQLDTPLGEPSLLMGVALQQNEDGDSDGAKRTWLDAVKKADKVRATNNWFPPQGQVRHQDKWRVMGRILTAGVQMGFAKESLEQFNGHNASIRLLAQALGGQDGEVQLRQWIKSFDESARSEGARCYALLGLAEGMMAK